MSQTPLIKKLRIQPGQRIRIINPPEGYMDLLGPLPEDVEIVTGEGGELDFVHLFVQDVAELEALGPEAIEAVRHDGFLWVSCPKRSSGVKTDLTRDHGWGVISEAGLRPVTQISIDAVWSALRMRPVGKVGT